jgi:threonine dehydrogenase-like Zn-dependent dehydrogenase
MCRTRQSKNRTTSSSGSRLLRSAGSDLHLYGVLGPFLKPGDVLGHEPMGIVEEIGPDITRLRAGDRVVIPFNISCGHCWMCQRGLFAQCETAQVRDQGQGAALLGYTSLYG